MAYTPTNWSTGDTITASDMNKLENVVANASSIITCIDGIIYFVNSTIGHLIYGNFANALAKARQGVPVVVYEAEYNSGSGWFSSYLLRSLVVRYEESHPDRIDIQFTGGVGCYWTANGLQYYD